jgi:hypothetical protein
METPSRTRPVLGIDVGKRSHWARLVAAEGEIALNASFANRERDLNELFSKAPGNALVVVGQVRNIGTLALKSAARGGRGRLREAAGEENLGDRLRACNRHRRRRVRQPRQARLLLRAGTPQQAVGDLPPYRRSRRPVRGTRD